MKLFKTDWFPILLGIVCLGVILNEALSADRKEPEDTAIESTYNAKTNEWQAPDIDKLPFDNNGDLIRYGRDLIVYTALYFGPGGKVASITNGLNCQNCHLDGGTRYYANCYSAVASIYPVFKPRSGIIESIGFRVNDCMKRSLNGQAIDTSSKEMKAMIAYMLWLGKDVPKKTRPNGAGIQELLPLPRAADTAKGRIVYRSKCQSCHTINGEGVLKPDHSGYIYPPLWGDKSFNTGAGLYRLSRFAGYIKNAMPFGLASYKNPQLTDEEAWDVAAFVNSQPRPVKTFPEDWPDISKKVFDCPLGPYIDGFSEQQHKYGPYGPIKEAIEKKQKGK